jgi:hypothetical protein
MDALGSYASSSSDSDSEADDHDENERKRDEGQEQHLDHINANTNASSSLRASDKSIDCSIINSNDLSSTHTAGVVSRTSTATNILLAISSADTSSTIENTSRTRTILSKDFNNPGYMLRRLRETGIDEHGSNLC